MSKHDDERFHNLIVTGTYATDEEIEVGGLVIVVCLIIAAVGYGLYRLFS